MNRTARILTKDEYETLNKKGMRILSGSNNSTINVTLKGEYERRDFKQENQ